MYIYGPGIRHVPDYVWRSPYFWIMLVLMIIGILLYHNYFRNMTIGSIFSKLFGSSGTDNPGGAKIRYESQGRSGYVWYESREAKFSMYYEFGGGDCIVGLSVPSVQEWEASTGLPLDRRDEVLVFVGRQVVKDQTTGGKGSFKIEGTMLNIYA